MKKKNSKTKSNKLSQKKMTEDKKESYPSILSTGIIDLTLKINFTDEDLKKNDNNEENKSQDSPYYNIDDFKSISDLEFLKDRRELWDKFQLIPNNSTLEHLLLANILRKKKVITEYVGFGRPGFTDREEFFEEIFNYISKNNNIIFNKTPLSAHINCHIRFEFFHKDKRNNFEIESSGGDTNQENEDQNKTVKKKEKPEFSRSNSFFKKLNLLSEKYYLFYLNYQDLDEFSNYFQRIDLIELIYFLRKRGTKIFINFFKQEMPKKEESIKEEDNDINSEHFDAKSVNFIEPEDNQEEEEEKEEEETDEKSKKMNDINNIYYFTDLYFFDSKQAPKKFNKHYNFFTSDKIKSKVNKGNIYDYFLKGIATGTKDTVDKEKYGFFIEYFNKLYIIKVDKNIGNKYEFDLKIHPQINHYNMKIIETYKEIIKNNKNYYIALILSYILGTIIENHSTSIETLFKGYASGLEAIKKKLELQKNNLDIKEDDYMKGEMGNNEVDIKIKTLQYTGQENGFILDCTNKVKSEMKDYVPLYDTHMVNFLRNKTHLDELKKKGFINNKGYIMVDSQYRNIMKNDEQAFLYDKNKYNKTVESKIKNINVLLKESDRLKDPKKEALNTNKPTKIMIPKQKFGSVGLYNALSNGLKTKKKNAKNKNNNNKENNENSKNIKKDDKKKDKIEDKKESEKEKNKNEDEKEENN